MMAQQVQPQIGMRFELRGSKFEITFVAHGLVRYAATAGGTPFKLPIERFIELQQQGTLILADSSGIRISETNAPNLVRRHRYVEAALRQLPHPTAASPLKQLIHQVAIEHSDAFPPSIRTVARWLNSYKRLGINGLARIFRQ